MSFTLKHHIHKCTATQNRVTFNPMHSIPFFFSVILIYDIRRLNSHCENVKGFIIKWAGWRFYFQNLETLGEL